MTCHRCKPLLGTAPCIPSTRSSLCRRCDRRNDSLPTDAEFRPWTVAIDASVLKLGPCPMFIPRAVRPSMTVDDIRVAA